VTEARPAQAPPADPLAALRRRLSPFVLRRLAEKLERAERLGQELPVTFSPRPGRSTQVRFGHPRPPEEVCD
jgi:hypothetical protein